MATKKTPKKATKPARITQALHTSPARLQVCPGCRRQVWAGYVDGLRVRVEAVPLAAADLVMAMLVQRRLYLKMADTLALLNDDRMGLTARYPVMAAHSCAAPIRVSPKPAVTRAALPGTDPPPY